MESNQQELKMKEPNFKVCPCCESKDLIKFEVDYFCMDCDWNSILFDVYSGNFEKRIALAYRKPNSQNPRRSKSKILHLNTSTNEKRSDEEEVA